MKNFYIECGCRHVDHMIRIVADKKDEYNPLYVEFRLNHVKPWYCRIWLAIKYIFGYQSSFGSYDCILLERKEAKKLVAIIKEVYP